MTGRNPPDTARRRPPGQEERRPGSTPEASIPGAAFDRVLAALDKAGRQPRIYGSGKATAHCPGPGHWRGDQTPSLIITPGDGCALLYCHALCSTEDVLAAVGLTAGDLYDQPRAKRPGRNQLRDAISKARGLTGTERYLYLWLLWRADWDTCIIPPQFQPRSQRDLAAAAGLNRVTVQQATGHLILHHWLAVTCAASGCKRDHPHQGRGHRLVYGFPGVGENCPGRGCEGRREQKAVRRSHLRLVSGSDAAASPFTTSFRQNRLLTCDVAQTTRPFSGHTSRPFSDAARSAS